MDDRDVEELDFRNADQLNQQRRIYKRRPKTARDLINSIITRRGIAAEKSNNELDRVWNEVVGPGIAQRTRAGSIKRGKLEVIVESSSLMQQLGFFKEDYLERINLKLRDSEIKDLRFRIGRID